jgi:outer membrane protein OmpA-like peptidoglycan-associated protein
MKKSILVATVAVSLGISSSAFAQAASGFAIDRFDPSERGSGWFAADSLDFRGDRRPAIGIVASYAYKPLIAYNADGTERAAIVQDLLVLHPGASVVLWNRLRLAMDIPIALVDDGTSSTAAQTGFTAPDGPSIGDVRVSADVRLFGTTDGPITVAAGIPVYLPSGSQDHFTGDGTVRLEPRVMAAGEISSFAYAARFGVLIRPDTDNFGSTQLGSELTFAAAAGLHRGILRVGPEIYGSTTTANPFDGATTPFEALLGAHVDVARDFRFGAAVGPGITRGLGAPEVRGILSAEWAPAYTPPTAPLPDSDHDGVWDGEDACPTIAGIKTEDPKTNGCPPDRDSDGIFDGEDACPTVAGVRTNDPKTNGCPPDADHDGIADADDACPTIAGIKTNDPKTNGCPPDRDADGIPDSEDACPMVAGVRTDDPKTNGCPADRDHDGILDSEDACPDVAGARDPDLKKNGCPPAFLQGGQIKIRDPFKFRFDKTELDPAGDPILEAVLQFLKDHPELKHIRIEGHTDNVGSAASNQKLSEGRAASVRKWLVAHGIDAARLKSVGYGQTKPVDDNGTDEGRRNNRRVEFHIEE